MASNLNYKQVANVSRRKWDAESYEQRAKERQARDDADPLNDEPSRKEGAKDTNNNVDNDSDAKQEFQSAPAGAAGPEGSKRAFLRARQESVDLESKVGTSEMMVSADNAVTKTGIGWHCKVCDCFLKDSHTYLDHINGKKHQRKLGFSMRVERSTKDQVLDRLQAITQQQTKERNKNEFGNNDIVHLDELVKQKDETLQREREEKKRQRNERKKALETRKEGSDDEDEVAVQGIDSEMAAMMGFSGFGGGNKN